MLYLDSGDNFFVKVWEAILGFFTNAEANWIWFIVIGAGLLVLAALIVILIIVGRKKKKSAEKRDTQSLLEEQAKEDEAAELARIRRERELAVRNESEMTVDELIARRVAEEKAAQNQQLEEEERKLQETFAAESVTEQPAEAEEEIPLVQAEEITEEPIPVETETLPEEVEPAPEPEKEPEIIKQPEPEEKKAAAAKKPAAKKPTETVLYSIVYDRAAREWVVRKTGSPRAIRRLRTKAEALEYAEQLSVRQGLSLQVHKKDGKFQKQ